MDIATHALSSLALGRGFFPRRRWPVTLGMVFAGTIADIDLLSSVFGPAAYFAGHRTFTHSLVGTLVVVAVATLFVRYLSEKQTEPVTAQLLPLAAAAALHVLLDLFQAEGVALLWPARPTRFSADWLPIIDPWILAVLIAGILVPELFRLITSEIGVKDKTPRGRNGSLVALAVIVGYVVARVLLHSGSVASLDPHSYKGESARKVAAYPDAFSLFTWHGVVETQSLLCQVAVPAGTGEGFDPDAADCWHKPEASAELDTAQKSGVAQKYLQVMPFPRASVSRSPDGYEIVIRSMRDIAERETHQRIAAQIFLNSGRELSSEELMWVSDVHLR